MRKVALPGHYRPPTVRLPGMGGYNAPTRGRVGKQMPSPPKFTGRPFPKGGRP